MRITNNPGVYEGRVEFHHVQVRLISSNEPLMGCDPLPNWLHGKRCIYSIDNTDNNLCVWRCLVISERIGCNQARPAINTTREAPNLAREFYNQPKLRVRDVRATKLVDFENIALKFKVNIRLYEPKNQSTWKLVFGQNQFKSSLLNVDIGLYIGHCFYIKDLDVLTNHWKCVGCQQRFTQHQHYNRHVTENRCTGGQTKLICSGKKFKHIMNSSEKVFHGGNTQFSWKACKWIECHSERIGRHIHHAFCGHGGERCVVIIEKEILVDGHDPETSTIYQFYGCKWHGCPCITGSNDKYQKTLNLENQIRSLGYNIVSVWKCKNPEVSNRHLQKEFVPYSHYIAF